MRGAQMPSARRELYTFALLHSFAKESVVADAGLPFECGNLT
jgi:hypothetical protein